MNNLPSNIFSLARVIWDYHFLRQELTPADIILVLSSNDIRVADHAAEVFNKGLAPLIVFSGGIAHANDLLASGWSEPEARVLAGRAIECGLPADKILLEEKATNTGDNFDFTADLLAQRGINFSSAILVQKPFMLRRAYATGAKRWPGKKLTMTAQNVGLEEYLAKAGQPAGQILNIMIGDLQRIKLYPEKGFQIPQEIPDDVWRAYEQLVAQGYDRHIIR